MILTRHVQSCPRCSGREFSIDHDGRRFLCRAPGCGLEFFLNSAAAVGVILHGPDGRLLVLRRAHDPGRGLLGLPGGFADAGETAEAAACRETREETGLELDPGSLSYFTSAANLYLYHDVTYQTLDLFFSAPCAHLEQARARAEVSEVILARPEYVDPAAFAFPSTRTVMARFLSQGKRV